MAGDSAELLIQRAQVVGRVEQLREALRALPGVQRVGTIDEDVASIEARVSVDFDPGVTNPVVLREALARAGFTVLSAAETTTSMGKGDAGAAGPPQDART
jgi:carbon monoxide dehydrogenase subunit G